MLGMLYKPKVIMFLKIPYAYIANKQYKQVSVKEYSSFTSSILPIGVSLMGLASIAYYIIRIPPPNRDIVESVIGKDLISELPSKSKYYFMKTVAHRGAGLDAPENSIPAFSMCCRNGCQAVEFDIALTSDHVPIVFHDDTLKRIADLNLVVSESPWNQLQKVDISVKHPLREKFSPVRIPTLDQAINHILKCKDLHMFIDLKGSNTKITKIIIDLFQRYPELYSKAVVTSFFPHIIYFIRRKNPKIVCSLNWRPKLFSHRKGNNEYAYTERRSQNFLVYLLQMGCNKLYDWCLLYITDKILGVSLILMHKDSVTPKIISKWQNKNIRVVAWTVNCPLEKHYFGNTLKITYMTDTLNDAEQCVM